MSTTVEENVYRAIETIAENMLSQLKYDKTIKAEIVSLENADTGEYKIKYAGAASVTAYAQDITQLYKAGDIVFVKCIEQDLSEQKFITGKVTRDSLSATQMTQLQNSIIERSPSLDAFYSYDPETRVGVVAGAPVSSDLSHAPVYTFSSGESDLLFQQYAKKYTHIRIQAKFKTQLRSIHSKGNYGLRVTFLAAGNTTATYILDLSSFNASPYRLNHWSTQDIVFEVPANYLEGLRSIELFEEGFEYDEVPDVDGDTVKQNTTNPNIFVKDVSIQYVDVIDMSDVSYYPLITAPYGSSFPITRNSGIMVLTAHLYHQGQDLSKCSYQWYQRNLSITSGLEDYNDNAGVGWEAISGETNQSLSITSSQVPHSQQYKVVITYNTVVVTAEIEVSNSQSVYSFSITQVFEEAKTKLRLTNGYTGEWYFLALDNNYGKVGSGNQVDVTDYLTAAAITFYCAVYKDGIYLGVLPYNFTNSESEEDVIVSYSGEDTFRYDANGDITYEDYEKARTLSVDVTPSPHISLLNPTLSWYMLDGTPIPTNYNSRISPSSSMLNNLWVDNTNNLHYTIAQKYRQSYTNNILSLRISTLDGKVYTFNKEILFLKDGDQGTNGTTYVCAVRPCTSSGVKLTGFNSIKWYNNALQNRLYLQCYVYKDGDLVTSGVTYKWEAENLSLSSTSNNRVYITNCNAPNLSNSKEMEYYVKVQVTVNGVSIYALYPVNMVVGTSIVNDLVDIDDIPSYIKYTSSGVKPSLYSKDLRFIYNGVDRTSSISSLSSSLLTVNGAKLVPADSFMSKMVDDPNTIGVLKCTVDSSNYIIHPIVMYLDTYGNEAINGWDGTKLELDENGKYIFAPQVGAGNKDSYNRFTGVVMGEDSNQKLVGLYGYQAGVTSFGLMADGTAFFGRADSGGRITINGKTATISGGSGSNGMTITLADLNPSSVTKAIKVGNDVFTVTYDGSMYAIKGKIGGASASDSNGWTIETNRLYSGSSTSHVELNSNSNETYAIWAGRVSSTSAPFRVSKTGDLVATSADITGKISSKEGDIGGWKISRTGIYDSTGRVGMSRSGSYRFWVGTNASVNTDGEQTGDMVAGTDPYFYVTSAGKLGCRGADVSGKVTATSGQIGGWTITSSSLYSGNTYLNSNGTISGANISGGTLSISDNFYVDSRGVYLKGTIVTDNITATGGTIGGWTLSGSGTNRYLYAGNTYLYSSGVIATNTFTINNKGQIGAVTTMQGNSGLGIVANSGSVVIEGRADSRFSTTSGGLYLQNTGGGSVQLISGQYYLSLRGNTLSTNATNLSGFYARFAP